MISKTTSLSLVLLTTILLCLLQPPLSYAQDWVRTDTGHYLRLKKSEDSFGRDAKDFVAAVKPNLSGASGMNLSFSLPDEHSFLIITFSSEPSSNVELSQSKPVESSASTLNVETSDCRHRFFQRRDDCFEWEIEMSRRPASPCLRFPFSASNLTFYYQDSLSEYERSLGAERPDSVIDSYAAYYNQGGIGTGKAMHLYRPRVWDASNDTIWAGIVIDTVNRELQINLDDKFLANAVYPVTIDPTFGHAVQGASAANVYVNECFGHRLSGQHFTPAVPIRLDSIGLYVKSSTLSGVVNFGVYTVDGSVPDQRMDTTHHVTITSASAAWFYAAAEGVTLSAGLTYGLTLRTVASPVRLYFDSGTSGTSKQVSATMPADWAESSTLDWIISMYAVYTELSRTPLSHRRRKVAERLN